MNKISIFCVKSGHMWSRSIPSNIWSAYRIKGKIVGFIDEYHDLGILTYEYDNYVRSS